MLKLIELDFEVHPIARAKQYYKVDLEVEDLHAMIVMINNEETICTVRYPWGAERHLVKYKDIVFPVIFDPESNEIKTVLPNCRHRQDKSNARPRQTRGRFRSFDRTFDRNASREEFAPMRSQGKKYPRQFRR